MPDSNTSLGKFGNHFAFLVITAAFCLLDFMEEADNSPKSSFGSSTLLVLTTSFIDLYRRLALCIDEGVENSRYQQKLVVILSAMSQLVPSVL